MTDSIAPRRNLSAAFALPPVCLFAVGSSAQTVLDEVEPFPLSTADFGERIERVGDLNGDGCAGFIIADPYTVDDRGLVRVVSGCGPSQYIYQWRGGGDIQYVGWTARGIDDIYGDGVADLAIGSIVDDESVMRFVSGATGSTIYTLRRPSNVATLAPRSIGDVDGDGVSDFVQGASP